MQPGEERALVGEEGLGLGAAERGHGFLFSIRTGGRERVEEQEARASKVVDSD